MSCVKCFRKPIITRDGKKLCYKHNLEAILEIEKKEDTVILQRRINKKKCRPRHVILTQDRFYIKKYGMPKKDASV